MLSSSFEDSWRRLKRTQIYLVRGGLENSKFGNSPMPPVDYLHMRRQSSNISVIQQLDAPYH
jgi:hypothetical protein